MLTHEIEPLPGKSEKVLDIFLSCMQTKSLFKGCVTLMTSLYNYKDEGESKGQLNMCFLLKHNIEECTVHMD